MILPANPGWGLKDKAQKKKMLENRAFKVGRHHVRTLMRKMRIRVIYCQPPIKYYQNAE